eukprot:scaffold14621_cov44-Phaeocystis_antarctica.AAC.2
MSARASVPAEIDAISSTVGMPLSKIFMFASSISSIAPASGQLMEANLASPFLTLLALWSSHTRPCARRASR